MPCPKCNERLNWKERSWTAAGEEPGHWYCLKCGTVVWPDRTTKESPAVQKPAEIIPKVVPSPECGEKEEDEMKRTDAGKECTRKECKRHGQVLPFSEFSKNQANQDGLEYYCKECRVDISAAKRERIKKEAGGGNGRRKRRSKNSEPIGSEIAAPRPMPPEAVTLDAQLLRAVKKSAILDFIKNDLPRMVEEAYR